MTAIQAESSKQTAEFPTEVAKLTESLEAKFRQENEKLAASLTESFETEMQSYEKNLMLNCKMTCSVFPKE
jgi:Skp family chaperone for outer membrane proteins